VSCTDLPWKDYSTTAPTSYLVGGHGELLDGAVRLQLREGQQYNKHARHYYSAVRPELKPELKLMARDGDRDRGHWLAGTGSSSCGVAVQCRVAGRSPVCVQPFAFSSLQSPVHGFVRLHGLRGALFTVGYLEGAEQQHRGVLVVTGFVRVLRKPTKMEPVTENRWGGTGDGEPVTETR
jgi:hypothetical protein